jgi:glutaredoxin 3
MANILMYCTGMCPYCVRAENLLRRKGVDYIEKIRVDLEPTQREEMMVRSGRRTVPQIFIDDYHVGGFDELVELDQEGLLEPMLAAG